MSRLARVLCLGVLLLPPLTFAEVQQCVVTREDKLVCPPIRRQDPSALSAPRQMFTGRVVDVLASDLLQVESQGTRMRVRVRHAMAGATRDDLAAVALHRTVSVYLREREMDGTLFADVLLDNRDNLLTILSRAIGQKPESIARRKQEEEARQRAVASQAQAKAAVLAKQAETAAASKKPLEKAQLCAVSLSQRCRYTIPGLLGVSLEQLVFSTHNWGGAEITATLHNRSGVPVGAIVLTVEWWQFGQAADTTTTIAVGVDGLSNGGAKAVRMMSMAPMAHYTDDFFLSARWAGQPTPVTMLREAQP